MKPIAIGCDEAAYDLKEQIKAHLADQGMELVDFGTFDSKAVLSRHRHKAGRIGQRR